MAAYFYSDMKRAETAPEEPKEDIVIGYNAPLTVNSVADFGIAGRQGFEIAIDEINARGGILGHRVRGVILDDKGDKELSKKNMEQLIFQDKALAVVGPGNSGNALYWLDLPQENEVIQIVHIATATEITKRFEDRPRNYIFRLSGLDIEQVRVLIAWSLKKAEKGRIAVLHDTTGYGTQGAKDVTEVLARWGKTPALVRGFEKTSTEAQLVAYIEAARDAGADVLYLYSLADSNAALVKALDKVEGYDPIVLASASIAVKQFWDLAGPLAERVHFSSPLYAEYNAGTKRLNQKIVDRYGTPPPTFSTAAYGYEAVLMLESAIVRARSLDRRAVRDALEGTVRFEGTRVYEKPFSKDDHEGSSIEYVFLARWDDGDVKRLNEETAGLEIR